MKKIKKENSFSVRGADDVIFEPDDNLYNNPYEYESLTFRAKSKINSEGQIFLKKLEKKSFGENFEEIYRDLG